MSAIEKIVKEAFQTEVGSQISTIYSTSDNNIFIRFIEADSHVRNNIKTANDIIISEWISLNNGNICKISDIIINENSEDTPKKIKQCTYCGRAESCKGVYPEGCFYYLPDDNLPF